MLLSPLGRRVGDEGLPTGFAEVVTAIEPTLTPSPSPRGRGEVALTPLTRFRQAQLASSGQRPSPSQQARGAAIGSRYGLAPYSTRATLRVE